MKYINTNTPVEEVQHLLEELGWIKDETITRLSSPGAGNMNVVLRVTTDKRSFILKQSRPFVQIYQDIPAPVDRIKTEYLFYQATLEDEVTEHMPWILAYDDELHLLMMEDLGDCLDMTTIYEQRSIDDTVLIGLVTIIRHIHEQKLPDQYPDNISLRQLNHQHIFVLPFMADNGFVLDDVQPGLEALATSYKSDPLLKSVVASIGDRYLSAGDTLLHGDYYPGSWMNVSNKTYVIDPEFSFAGFAEFDLGVMVAHIIMATSDDAYLSRIMSTYNRSVDNKLVSQVAGIEIMRRIIGLAQLPLERSIEEKDRLLKMACEMIL